MFPLSWPGGPLGVASRLGVNLTVLVASSLVLFVYERALIPVYGSGPSTYTLKSAALLATLAAATHPFKVSQTRTLLFGGFLFAVAPLGTYWVAVRTARWDKPIVGPIVTHSVVLIPLLCALATFVAEINVCYKTLCQATKMDCISADSNRVRPPNTVPKFIRIPFNRGTG
jgi:hypothetical protein